MSPLLRLSLQRLPDATGWLLAFGLALVWAGLQPKAVTPAGKPMRVQVVHAPTPAPPQAAPRTEPSKPRSSERVAKKPPKTEPEPLPASQAPVAEELPPLPLPGPPPGPSVRLAFRVDHQGRVLEVQTVIPGPDPIQDAFLRLYAVRERYLLDPPVPEGQSQWVEFDLPYPSSE